MGADFFINFLKIDKDSSMISFLVVFEFFSLLPYYSAQATNIKN
jgi:hypothetical protein